MQIAVPARRPRRLAAFALASLLATACTHEVPPAPRRDAVVAVPVGPQHLDPQGILDEYTASILHNSYEWLATFDPDLRPAASLAERWSTLDDRTWLFELRRGVRFHDGRPFDAAVAAEIYRREMARQPDVGEVIEGAEARSDHELLIRTREPQVAVVEVARIPMTLEPRSGSGPPVGTGPFTIADGRAGGDVRLRAFADHWGGPPPLDALAFRVIAGEDERVAELAQGHVDLVVNLSAPGARAVAALSGARLVTRGSLRVIALGFVTRDGGVVGRTPFADRRVRQAIACALDRPALVKEALGGYGEVVDQMVTPELFGHVADLDPIPYDPQTARELLAAAGHGAGFPLTLTFPKARYQAIESVAAAVVRQLGAVGVSVTARPEPSETIASDEPVAPAFLMGWITSHSAVRAYVELFHTPGPGRGRMNRTRYSDPSLDADIDAALTAPIDVQRRRLSAIGVRLRETLPVVPLYRQLDLYGVATGLRFPPRAQRLILGREMRWEGAAP